ncbi:MAG: hypothetical protein P1S46_11655 [bacterium]|nr:hypothetical protein [bacterium]MDT8395305.1 hypothetical protein [bacterium]
MAREDKVRQVAHLLQMADHAHNAYEVAVLHGKRDESWYEWYAEYLIGHGLDRILEDMLGVDRLARFLETLDEVRKGSSNLMDWRDGTARRMVDTLV